MILKDNTTYLESTLIRFYALLPNYVSNILLRMNGLVLLIANERHEFHYIQG